VGIWYATREDVKSALDSMETARNNVQVDRAIDAASRAVEGYTLRRFYPELDTRYFDWLPFAPSLPYRLWLDSNEVISLSNVDSGGTTISSNDYFLRRADGLDTPPYTMLEIDRSSNATLSGGVTSQRAVALTGLFGYRADTAPAGTVTEALDASETSVEVSDSYSVGVGTILLVDSEYMVCTEKSMLDTANVLNGDLTASMANVMVPAISGSAFTEGEVILIDAEKMRIIDIAGSNLIVKRAWDGSTLAAHNTGATIYAPRDLTVTRGALGSTAATHLINAPILKHVVPGLIQELTVAEALNSIIQELSGYARTAGSGENVRELTGRGLNDLRKEVKITYGRNARLGSA
jgi:hypothetical protein